MSDIRAVARQKQRQLVGAHRHEYVAAGITATRVRISMTGFTTYVTVDGLPTWKITVYNTSRKNAPDRVWVEDEYVGAPFLVDMQDKRLGIFIAQGDVAIARHY